MSKKRQRIITFSTNPRKSHFAWISKFASIACSCFRKHPLNFRKNFVSRDGINTSRKQANQPITVRYWMYACSRIKNCFKLRPLHSLKKGWWQLILSFVIDNKKKGVQNPLKTFKNLVYGLSLKFKTTGFVLDLQFHERSHTWILFDGTVSAFRASSV